MSGFLDLLLEGDTPDEELNTDDEAVKNVEESCLPMSTLIEAAFADVETGINVALETYEMACIIGGTKVAAEGLDQDGASEILTEASNGLFSTIWEQIKKACDWVVGMIQKLIINVQAIGKDIKAKYSKIEGDFNKNYKPGLKYKGYMFNMEKAGEILDAVNALGNETVLSAVFAVDNLSTEKGGPEKEMVISFANKAGITTKAETIKDLTADVKKALGIDGEASEMTVDDNTLKTMKGVVEACTKDAYKKEKQAINDAKKTANEAKKVLIKVNKEANTAKEKMNALSRTFSAWTHLMASVANLKLKLQYNAGASYLEWMRKVAKGKGGEAANTDTTGQNAASDNVEESFIPGYDVTEAFEYAEVSDILEACDSDCDDDDEMEESFGGVGGFSTLESYDGIFDLASQLLP